MYCRVLDQEPQKNQKLYVWEENFPGRRGSGYPGDRYENQASDSGRKADDEILSVEMDLQPESRRTVTRRLRSYLGRGGGVARGKVLKV